MLGRYAIVLGAFCGTLFAADQNAFTSGFEQQSLTQLNAKALQAAIAAGLPRHKSAVPLQKSLDDLFRESAQKQQKLFKPLMQPMARACAIPLLRAPVQNPDRFTIKKLPMPKTEDEIAKPAPVPACKE
ncbi:MAG TPA: hypothetical protein VFB14_01970 [Bryobacteraceae bacterium]|jgi:hypothetical protein|nr:hypothetical protein [Bryobacteraceae bacterium]